MERIDARRALEMLIDVVDQYGEDTVYEKVPLTQGNQVIEVGGTGCRYQYQRQPSCIVGHVLHRAGVPMDVLENLDMSGSPAGSIYGTVKDPDARTVLDAAQIKQDAGETWGDALRAAKEQYERIQKRDE